MKNYILAIIVVLVALIMNGCYEDKRNLSSLMIEADESKYTHKCTTDQMDRAFREAEWCIEHTTIKESYCWTSAIMRICEKRDNNTCPIVENSENEEE